MSEALWRWAAGPALGQLAVALGAAVLALIAAAWMTARREFVDPFDIEPDDELIDELDAEDVARLVGE